jgi:hypothetical protein
MDSATTALVQFGAVGIMALLGILVARVLYSQMKEAQAEEIRRLMETLGRERTRADRAEDELRRLNETIRTDYVATINRASQAMADANRAVSDALAAVRRS